MRISGDGVRTARLQQEHADVRVLAQTSPRARTPPNLLRRSHSQPQSSTPLVGFAAQSLNRPGVRTKRRPWRELARRLGLTRMGGSDDLLAALLDGLRPGRGARRAGVEPLRLPRPLRAGGARRLQRHRALARGPRARARDAHARRGEAAPRRQRPRVPRARVPVGVVPRSRRRAAPRLGRDAQAPVRGGGGARCAPHQGRQHPRHAVRRCRS